MAASGGSEQASGFRQRPGKYAEKIFFFPFLNSLAARETFIAGCFVLGH